MLGFFKKPNGNPGGGEQPKRLNIRYYTDYPHCNFKCFYCVAGHGEVFEKHPSPYEDGRYMRIVDTIMQVPRDVNIRIGVGGEFFVSNVLVEGGRKLSHAKNVRSLNLITNLSFSLKQYDKIFKGFDESKIALVASFHPTEVKNHMEWFEKAAAMDQRFDFAVICVGFPDFIDDLRNYKNTLNGLGVTVFIQPFLGEYKGRHYPKDYTREQHDALKSMIYSRHDYEYMMMHKKPGLCHAGETSVYVNPEGKVYPCGMGYYEEAIGDFTQSPALQLNDGPLPCGFSSCHCDTENINTVDFEQHYAWIGMNQHKYAYRFTQHAAHNPRLGEWEIAY